ncbi:MAG TPA: protein kinase [Gemmatimonadaceae bacterium]|nr:protein kinase [Gemmatimonadaceae bacterium]
MAESDPQHDLQSELGSGYTLERELGRGGTATVYLALDAKHQRAVALKVLHSDLAASLGPDRFRREIAFAAKLQHPHILTVLDSGETASGQLWFTMPYVEGESLRHRLERQRQLPLDDALRITREIALALDYAHRHGVIHRDVKPENILLVDEQAMLADFGIARGIPNRISETISPLTDEGTAIGTPAYMSPEQSMADPTVDRTTDIYSLGTVLYEMLAGEPPFSGPTAQAIAVKKMSGSPDPVRRIRPNVPPEVDAAIERALEPAPADRFQTGGDFAHALDARSRDAMAASAPVSHRRRRVGTIVLALAITAFLAAGIRYAWLQHLRATGGANSPGFVKLGVLPFDTQGDTANAYFADGITGEIRGKLSVLPGLSVIATTSSNQYRHTQKTPEQIGRELGVRYLLTGTVEWERNASGSQRVRVSPELVELREGAAPETRWRQSYDTTLADVFDVQSAVATRVADKLGVVLTQPAQTRLASRPTQNLAAYDAYLRSVSLTGLDHFSARAALASANEAIALDSSFAAAWARKSRLHSFLYLSTVPTSKDSAAARDASERAISLAPQLPDGFAARGDYYLYVANDATNAQAAYLDTRRLAPSMADVSGGLAYSEATQGQWSAALAHFREQVALDPRSTRAALDLSWLLLSLHRFLEARAEADRGLRIAPTDVSLIDARAQTFAAEGDIAAVHATMRNVPPGQPRAALLVFATTRWTDVCWKLDYADQALVKTTFTPATFDDDVAAWGKIRAQLFWLSNDTARARRYADSARVAYEAHLKARPNFWGPRVSHGLMLAYLGRRDDAIREGERGFALALATGDPYVTIPSARHELAQIYLLAGEHARAIAQLDTLLGVPYFLTPEWLRIDPTWAPLRGDAAFQKLLARPTRPLSIATDH